MFVFSKVQLRKARKEGELLFAPPDVYDFFCLNDTEGVTDDGKNDRTL
jgi:hypothetical protein